MQINLVLVTLLLVGRIFAVDNLQAAEEVSFIVNVSCLPNELLITWQVIGSGEYHASVNYVCTDVHGTETYGITHEAVSSENRNDGIITRRPPAEVVMNGGNCTVFGCHQLLEEGNPFVLNKNVSCLYFGKDQPQVSPVTEMMTASFSTSVAYSEDLVRSTSFFSDQTVTDGRTPTTPQISPTFVHYDQPTSPSTQFAVTALTLSTSIQYEKPTLGPESYTFSDVYTVQETPITNNAGTPARSYFTTVIAVTVCLIIPLVVLPTLVLIIIQLKKRQQKTSRFRYSGSTLCIETMDPCYIPVQVDSYNIHKCESTKSIIEFLTLHTDNKTALELSTNEKSEDFPYQRTTLNDYSHSYVLQLPPLKGYSNPLDTSLKLNSDYQSSTASMSPIHQAQQDSEVTTNYFKVQDTTYWHTRRHVACLNLLFDGKQHYNNSNRISSDDTNENNRRDSLDSLVLDELGDSESDNSSDITQDDSIMLSFPPTQGHSCNDYVKTEESDDKEKLTTTVEEDLAESNLTINPHHFDPL